MKNYIKSTFVGMGMAAVMFIPTISANESHIRVVPYFEQSNSSYFRAHLTPNYSSSQHAFEVLDRCNGNDLVCEKSVWVRVQLEDLQGNRVNGGVVPYNIEVHMHIERQGDYFPANQQNIRIRRINSAGSRRSDTLFALVRIPLAMDNIPELDGSVTIHIERLRLLGQDRYYSRGVRADQRPISFHITDPQTSKIPNYSLVAKHTEVLEGAPAEFELRGNKNPNFNMRVEVWFEFTNLDFFDVSSRYKIILIPANSGVNSGDGRYRFDTISLNTVDDHVAEPSPGVVTGRIGKKQSGFEWWNISWGLTQSEITDRESITVTSDDPESIQFNFGQSAVDTATEGIAGFLWFNVYTTQIPDNTYYVDVSITLEGDYFTSDQQTSYTLEVRQPYTNSQSTLYNSQQSIYVNIVNDNEDEPDGSVTLSITGVRSFSIGGQVTAYNAIAAPDVTVEIQDNDDLEFSVIAENSSIVEGGETSFQLWSNSALTEDNYIVRLQAVKVGEFFESQNQDTLFEDLIANSSYLSESNGLYHHASWDFQTLNDHFAESEGSITVSIQEVRDSNSNSISAFDSTPVVTSILDDGDFPQVGFSIQNSTYRESTISEGGWISNIGFFIITDRVPDADYYVEISLQLEGDFFLPNQQTTYSQHIFPSEPFTGIVDHQNFQSTALRVIIVDDDNYEPDGGLITASITGVFRRTGDGQIPALNASIDKPVTTITIQDDDQLKFSVVAENESIRESQYTRFEIWTNGPLDANYYVKLRIENEGNFFNSSENSAEEFFREGSDHFRKLNGLYHYGSIGQSTIGDNLVEPDGSISVRILDVLDSSRNSLGSSLFESAAAITIVRDDDYPALEFNLGASNQTYNERNASTRSSEWFYINTDRVPEQSYFVDMSVAYVGNFFQPDQETSYRVTIDSSTADPAYTIPTWKVIYVYFEDDNVYEPDGGSVTATIDRIQRQEGQEILTATNAVVPVSSVTIAVQDDEEPEISIRAVHSEVVEGTHSSVGFTLESTAVLEEDYRVYVEFNRVGKFIDLRKTSVDSTFTLPAGMTSFPIDFPSLRIVDDEVGEDNGSVTATIGRVMKMVSGSWTIVTVPEFSSEGTTVTIIDNDYRVPSSTGVAAMAAIGYTSQSVHSRFVQQGDYVWRSWSGDSIPQNSVERYCRDSASTGNWNDDYITEEDCKIFEVNGFIVPMMVIEPDAEERTEGQDLVFKLHASRPHNVDYEITAWVSGDSRIVTDPGDGLVDVDGDGVVDIIRIVDIVQGTQEREFILGTIDDSTVNGDKNIEVITDELQTIHSPSPGFGTSAGPSRSFLPISSASIRLLDNDLESAPTPSSSPAIMSDIPTIPSATAVHVEIPVADLAENTMETASFSLVNPIADRLEMAFDPRSSISIKSFIEDTGKIMNGDKESPSEFVDMPSFTMPVAMNAGSVNSITMWGYSDNQSIDDDAFNVSGDLESGHLGFDAVVSNSYLWGVSVSRIESASTFEYGGTVDNEQRYALDAIQSYYAWSSDDDLQIHATTGFGNGTLEYDALKDGEMEIRAQSADISLLSSLLGIQGNAYSYDDGSIDLKGSAMIARHRIFDNGLNIRGGDQIDSKAKFAILHTHSFELDSGELNPVAWMGKEWNNDVNMVIGGGLSFVSNHGLEADVWVNGDQNSWKAIEQNDSVSAGVGYGFNTADLLLKPEYSVELNDSSYSQKLYFGVIGRDINFGISASGTSNSEQSLNFSGNIAW